MILQEDLKTGELRRKYEEYINELMDGESVGKDVILTISKMIAPSDMDFMKVVPTVYVDKFFSLLKKAPKNYQTRFINEFVLKRKDPNVTNFIDSKYLNMETFFETFIKLMKFFIRLKDKSFFPQLSPKEQEMFSNFEKQNIIEFSIDYNNISYHKNEIISVLNSLEKKYEAIKEEIETRKKQRELKRFFENDKMIVYEMLDFENYCLTLGKGSSWCIANRVKGKDHFEKYSKVGKLFCFIFKDIKTVISKTGEITNEKILLTVPSEEHKERTINELNSFAEVLNKVSEIHLKPKINLLSFTTKDIHEMMGGSPVKNNLFNIVNEFLIQSMASNFVGQQFNNVKFLKSIFSDSSFNKFIEDNTKLTSILETFLNSFKKDFTGISPIEEKIIKDFSSSYENEWAEFLKSHRMDRPTKQSINLALDIIDKLFSLRHESFIKNCSSVLEMFFDVDMDSLSLEGYQFKDNTHYDKIKNPSSFVDFSINFAEFFEFEMKKRRYMLYNMAISSNRNVIIYGLHQVVKLFDLIVNLPKDLNEIIDDYPEDPIDEKMHNALLSFNGYKKMEESIVQFHNTFMEKYKEHEPLIKKFYFAFLSKERNAKDFFKVFKDEDVAMFYSNLKMLFNEKYKPAFKLLVLMYYYLWVKK